MDRAGRAVAWEVRRLLGGTYGRRGGGRVRQGQQRWRRARRGARPARLGCARRRARARRRTPTPAAVDRALGRADLARRRDVRHRVPRRARRRRRAAWRGAAATRADRRGRHPVGGRRAHRRGARRRGARRRRPSRSPRASPGSCFEPGRSRAARCTSPTSASTSTHDGPPLGIIDDDATFARWLVPRATPTRTSGRSGLLVVGGSGGMTGAPMLVSHAAMRVGAGIVWCGVPGRRRRGARVGDRGRSRRRCPATADGALAGDARRRARSASTGSAPSASGPGSARPDATRGAVRDLVATIAGAAGARRRRAQRVRRRSPARCAPAARRPILTPARGRVRAAARRAGRRRPRRRGPAPRRRRPAASCC